MEGTGLIGIWKALHEMKTRGWIDDVPTRMVAVQGAGCNPVIQSFQNNMDFISKYENPDVTIANGLRVPKPFADRMIMKTLFESKGTAVAVTEDEIKAGIHEFARAEGLFLSPEGAAVWEGFKKLKEAKWIKEEESVVLLNTGSGYKYVENLY